MKTLIPQKALYLGLWAGHVIDRVTMRKERSRWGLLPVDYDGLQPLFDPDDIERAKARRLAARLAQEES